MVEDFRSPPQEWEYTIQSVLEEAILDQKASLLCAHLQWLLLQKTNQVSVRPDSKPAPCKQDGGTHVSLHSTSSPLKRVPYMEAACDANCWSLPLNTPSPQATSDHRLDCFLSHFSWSYAWSLLLKMSHSSHVTHWTTEAEMKVRRHLEENNIWLFPSTRGKDLGHNCCTFWRDCYKLIKRRSTCFRSLCLKIQQVMRKIMRTHASDSVKIVFY